MTQSWGGAELSVSLYSFQKSGRGGELKDRGPCVLVKDKSEYSILYCPQLQTELDYGRKFNPKQERRLDGDGARKFDGAA